MSTESKKARFFARESISARSILALTVAAVSLGAALVYKPFFTIAAVGTIAGIVVAYLWRPTAVYAYFVFIVFQDLVLNFLRDQPEWFPIVKRLDEFVLLILLLVTLACHRSDIFRPVRLPFYFLAGTVLVGLVSTLLYATEWVLAGYDIFLLYKGFAVFYVVSQLRLDRRDVRFAISGVLWIGTLCLIAGALDLLLGAAYRSFINHPRPIEYRQGFPTIVAFFEHAGVTGWFLAFCACIALAYWIVKRRPLHLILTFGFAAGSLLTLRRKPIIGLATVFIVAIFLSSERRTVLRSVVAVGLLATCMAFTVGDLVIGAFQEMLSVYVYSPNPMNIARNSMHIASFQVAMDHFPLGAGYGLFGGKIAAMNYSPLYYEYGLSMVPGLMESRATYSLDAFWPHVLGELGFIGLVLFLLSLFFLVKPIAMQIDIDDSTRAVAAYGAVFVFIEALPESFGWAVFENTLASSLIFGFIALAWIARRFNSTAPSSVANSPNKT